MKTLFLQRKDLEYMLNAFMKVQNISRESAAKEIDLMLKTAEPTAKVAILNEFSVQNVEIKK